MGTIDRLITIIVPVAERHWALLPDALGSIEASTARDTVRAAVVFDFEPPAFEFEYNFPMSTHYTGGGKWSSRARNIALRASTTPLVSFLDADDAYTSTGLEMLLKAYSMWPNACYTYGDALTTHPDGSLRLTVPPSRSRPLIGRRNVHTVSALVRRVDALNVGGFDESLHGWEDWEFYMRLAEAGVCGHRVPSPIITYRLESGINRNASFNMRELGNYIQSRHADFIKGVTNMGCGCGGDAAEKSEAERVAMAMFDMSQLDKDGKVPMEYVGDKAAPVTFNVNERSYSAGLSQPYFGADPRDVVQLEALGWFRRMPVASGAAVPATLSKSAVKGTAADTANTAPAVGGVPPSEDAPVIAPFHPDALSPDDVTPAGKPGPHDPGAEAVERVVNRSRLKRS